MKRARRAKSVEVSETKKYVSDERISVEYVNVNESEPEFFNKTMYSEADAQSEQFQIESSDANETNFDHSINYDEENGDFELKIFVKLVFNGVVTYEVRVVKPWLILDEITS